MEKGGEEVDWKIDCLQDYNCYYTIESTTTLSASLPCKKKSHFIALTSVVLLDWMRSVFFFLFFNIFLSGRCS